MNNIDELRVLEDRGAGRSLTFVSETGGSYSSLASQVVNSFAERGGRVLAVECMPIGAENWSGVLSAFQEVLEERKVRQSSIVAFGAASVIPQGLVLSHLKGVRTLVLVDAAPRANPSSILRSIDRIERSLPLGLPFRLRGKAFDSKPFLHRIRCPVLLVTTHRAGSYEREQATLLCRALPTAWQTELSTENEAEQLVAWVRGFQDVPAKCPQKVRTV